MATATNIFQFRGNTIHYTTSDLRSLIDDPAPDSPLAPVALFKEIRRDLELCNATQYVDDDLAPPEITSSSDYHSDEHFQVWRGDRILVQNYLLAKVESWTPSCQSYQDDKWHPLVVDPRATYLAIIRIALTKRGNANMWERWICNWYSSLSSKDFEDASTSGALALHLQFIKDATTALMYPDSFQTENQYISNALDKMSLFPALGPMRDRMQQLHDAGRLTWNDLICELAEFGPIQCEEVP
ncbi:hypothetical protein V8F20_006029 [Naviculisporaceae sp. PSN 640]